MEIDKDKRLKRIKAALSNEGVMDCENTSLDRYLLKKPTMRFIQITRWLRSQRLEADIESISLTYRADVVIRRMLAEILKPLELELQSLLVYHFESLGANINEIRSGKYYEDIFKFKSTSLFEKRINSISFMGHLFKKMNKKVRNNISLAFSELSFGQSVTLLSILDQDVVDCMLREKTETKKSIIIPLLENLVGLRNHIAHHNLVLTNDTIYTDSNNKMPINIKEVITMLDLIATGDYKAVLRNEILKYKERLMSKEKLNKDKIEKIIEAILTFLI